MVVVSHQLNIAASSMSSLLGLTSYKSFLRMLVQPASTVNGTAATLTVYHLGWIDVPRLADSALSMVQAARDGLWHVVAPELMRAVGLIRTTVIPLGVSMPTV